MSTASDRRSRPSPSPAHPQPHFLFSRDRESQLLVEIHMSFYILIINLLISKYHNNY